MMTNAGSGQILSMVDKNNSSNLCTPIGWLTLRIWQGVTPELHNYLVPYTAEYVASENVAWRFKSADGHYLANFAGLPVPICWM